MYESFYNMTHTPFVRSVPPEALYETPAMAEALGRLEYAADHQLFAVVMSDAGCGKTTLIRKFASVLAKDNYLLPDLIKNSVFGEFLAFNDISIEEWQESIDQHLQDLEDCVNGDNVIATDIL